MQVRTSEWAFTDFSCFMVSKSQTARLPLKSPVSRVEHLKLLSTDTDSVSTISLPFSEYIDIFPLPLISVPTVQNRAEDGIQDKEKICESTLFSATDRKDPSWDLKHIL